MDANLQRLAELHGVSVEYTNVRDERIAVPRDTVRLALAALGVSTESDSEIRAQLEGPAPKQPVVVTPDGRPPALPPGDWLECEVVAAGNVRHELRISVSERGRSLDASSLPEGYHEIRLRGRAEELTTTLVVAPHPCYTLEGSPAWGLAAQLPELRSADSWGIGDYEDLAQLGTRAATRFGCDFILTSPLGSGAPAPPLQPSPYSPSSRAFLNALYLRPDDAAVATSSNPRLSALKDAARELNRTTLIDRDRAYALKMEALEALWRGSSDTAPQAEGTTQQFALFQALAERHGPSFADWPEELRVASAAPRRDDALQQRSEFHRWLQSQAVEQVRSAHARMREAGARVGLIHDLPIGFDRWGADAWMQQGDIAHAFSIGAPPDTFNPAGQSWGLPPLLPNRLIDNGGEPFRSLVRTLLALGGGVRIDHVLGLFRLFWVPAGGTPADGVYVQYPADLLMAILAIESRRAQGVVIGEDLGTVAPGVRERLHSFGIHGTEVLYFAKDGDQYLPPERLRADALASISTHDLPTAAGYWSGYSLAQQEREGLVTPEFAREADAAAEQDREALVDALGSAANLDDPVGDRVVAMHTYIGRSSSRFVATSLRDMLLDERQPNVPGSSDYPNWNLPLTRDGSNPILVEEALDDAHVLRCIDALRAGLADRSAAPEADR